MKKIKSYEDVLKVLGKTEPEWLKEVPADIRAYSKLCTICEALNIGHKQGERIYYPWWFMKDLRAGVAARYSYRVLAAACSTIGFRLCCFDEKTALYFGSKPFIKLWQDYLL